jgi:hypothetical protein
VKNPAQLIVLSVPLKGRLASLLEEGVPILFLAKFFVIFGKKIHNCRLCNKDYPYISNNTALRFARQTAVLKRMFSNSKAARLSSHSHGADTHAISRQCFVLRNTLFFLTLPEGRIAVLLKFDELPGASTVTTFLPPLFADLPKGGLAAQVGLKYKKDSYTQQIHQHST